MNRKITFLRWLLPMILGFFLLSSTGIAQSRLEVTPATLDLGSRPIGAWMEPAIFTLTNSGTGSVIVNSSEITASDFFDVVNPALPLTLAEGGTVEVGISTPGTATAGTQTGSYAVQWGSGSRTVTVADFTANAYTPVTGDVFEMAFEATLPISETGVSTANFYHNYEFNGPVTRIAAGKDAVYAFTLATDQLFSATLTGAGAKMAIYSAPFGANEGPGADNALYTFDNTASNVELFAGDYYLVVSVSDVAYDLSVTATAMPAPGAVTYVAPSDGAVDVINGDDLSWTFGANTFEYQVVLGTTYPPATVVVAWTSDLAEAYTLVNTQPNLQYFWQVNTRNTNGTTYGAVWGFTTTLTPPAELAGTDELYEGQDEVLTWSSPLNRALLGYNVYRDGVQLNTDVLTAATYTDVAPAYNMVGYNYNVTAVFDEGESAYSNTFTVKVTGEGTVDGNVTEMVTPANVIEGATVTLTGVDEFGTDQTYTFTTDAAGDYTGDVLAGTYTIVVSMDGYQDATLADVAVAYGTTVTNNFALYETAYPVAVVTASAMGDNVLIEWSFDAATFVPQQYPFDTKGMTEAQIQKAWNGFLAENNFTASNSNRALVEFEVYREKSYIGGTAMELVGTTSQSQFVDFDWSAQDWGVYKWYVVAVYDLESSVPVASNPLDKDMYTTVEVSVSLNSGDSPASTFVEFTNVDESPELTYSVLLPVSGTYAWDSFRKGTYDIAVTLPGYAPINLTAVDIFDVASFEWLLEEQLAKPTNLYVTPTGLATWEAGVIIPFVPVVENFDAGVPAGWTIELGPDAELTDNWQNVAAYGTSSLDGTPFMFINSDAAGNGLTDGILTSPVVNTSNTDALYVEFDQYYVWSSFYPTTATVEVFDGSSWVEVANQVATAGSWSSPAHSVFDVTAYKNDAFQVRFHYTGSWAYYWAVDNVAITNVAPPAPRSFTTYKLFLDNVLLGELTDTQYQHGGAFGDVLVDGQTYTTEVAAVYTTGQSDKASYTWKYVACDNYAAPADFTAAQVEGTLNIALNWTNPDAAVLDTISAIRIYRNGEQYTDIDFTAGAVNTFVDETLDFGTYNYCVTYIYDSGAETCANAVCSNDVVITGGGYVNGTVTAFVGGAPIEGATVTFSNDTYSFPFTTDLLGYYEGEVVEGTYTVTVTADTYESQTLEGVVVTFGATVTNDFALLEFPYPVGDVTATELSDNAVQVNWGPGGGGNIAEWLFYDDGINVDGIGGPAVFSWAIKFDPAQLEPYAGTSLTKISIYNRTADVNTLQIFEGPNASTLLYEQQLTGLPIEDWAEVELTTPVAIDVTKELWITVYTTAGAGYPAGCGASTGQPNGDLISMDGILWEHMADIPLPYTWNLRGFVTDMVTNRIVELGDVQNTAGYKAYPANTAFVASGNLNTSANAIIDATIQQGDRALTGYNVYRTTCATGDLQFMGYVLDQQFTDNTWGAAESGVYKWGVVAVYDLNESEIRFSNCLDKDMITQVSVTVATNSGDSPAETDVLFTNTSEPDLGLTYETTLDDSGYFAWDVFRKGIYDINVDKRGFTPIALTGVVIDSPQDFEWILEEMLTPVADLYVTPTGYATWRQGGIIPFEPFMEDFNAGLPDTWTITDGGSTADTWYNTPDYDGYSVDGTPFMFANSDAAGIGSTMDEMLTSPVIDGENADQLFLIFDYAYLNLSTDYFAVEVFNGTDWVEIFYTQDDTGAYPWPTTVNKVFDVTEYANAAFQVRFHYVAPGWDWFVGVDNVIVTDNMDRYADRELQNYKVWLDGNFVTDTPNTFWQYDVTNLVPGQDYLAEVAAVYTNGMSAKMQYVWTYYPCDSFPGPAVFTAERVGDTPDVLLTWSDILPMQLVEITQNPGSPSNGYFQQYGYGYGVVYDLTAYPDALANSIEFHHASWGTTGTWQYNIHIINWDTEATIAVLGPFTTTVNDNWELGVELGDVDLMGATNVAFLMEPLSNSSTDAYPDMSSDDASNPQGSVYGPLSDVASIGSSTIGNFLMNIYIMTANSTRVMAPVSLNLPVAVAATPRVNVTSSVTVPVIDNQTAMRMVDDAFVGANIYRNGVMIADMVADTFYLDEQLDPGYYDYCITYLYESGAESCAGSMCAETVLIPEECTAPVGLTATLSGDQATAILDWNTFAGAWLSYGDGVYVDAIGLTDFSPVTVAVQWDPADLANYDGNVFSKVNFYYGTGSIGDVTVQIWEGTTLVMEQAVTTALVGESWNEVTLTSPVVIDATKSYRIGYTVANYDAYPCGAQNYTGDPNSDLVLLNGAWDHINNYLPYSWMLETFVSSGMSAAVNAPVESTVLSHSGNGTLVSSPVPVDVTRTNVGKRNNSRSFMGYNVYRDGVVVNSELVAENHYEDTPYMGPATFCYTVTAVYSVCGESAPSNEVCLYVPVGIDEIGVGEARLYPNPATNRVTVEAKAMNHLTITNYVGQVVFNADLTGENTVQLNTSTYEPGIYIIQINTNYGVVTKRVVITK